jgi:hypothetical protein
MATASPLEHAPAPLSDTDPASSSRTVELGRAYAEHLQATQPEHFATLGSTIEELATQFAEPGLTIDESVAAAYMSAAEGRYLQFCATREDLVELGHSPDEIDVILEEQRAHACASSS